MISEDVSTASLCRDHNATSYSTETYQKLSCNYVNGQVEIITLRAIALKLLASRCPYGLPVEIITLRAIALKLEMEAARFFACECRDHNATSYSTETYALPELQEKIQEVEIITLRAIALKPRIKGFTSQNQLRVEIITLRAIALKLSRMSRAMLFLRVEIITCVPSSKNQPLLTAKSTVSGWFLSH